MKINEIFIIYEKKKILINLSLMSLYNIFLTYSYGDIQNLCNKYSLSCSFYLLFPKLFVEIHICIQLNTQFNKEFHKK